MAYILVHGYVQLWNTKKGMSKSKGAFIETVKGRKNIKLLLYFNTGRVKSLQLNDNIKSVALRSYREDQNHLHLTFQNNDFLFIERLSSTDAQQLKIFLDKVHQKDGQPPMRPDNGGGIFSSTTVLKGTNPTPLHEVCEEASSGSFETAKESKISVFQNTHLFPSKSSTFISKGLFKNRLGKRKRVLSVDSERNENENFLKENNFIRSEKSKANPFTYDRRYNRKKHLNLRWLEENKKLAFGFSFRTNFSRNPYLGGTGPPTFREKIFSPFLLKPNYSEDSPEWNECEMAFVSYPEKLWQGLPNLGNTCYMNAVLQSLCSIPSFVNDLVTQDFPWTRIPHDTFNICLAQLLILKDTYNVKMKEKLLVNIKKAISVVAEIFSGDTQNDAHEFLGICFGQIKETIQKLNMIWELEKAEKEKYSCQRIFVGNAATEMLVCPVTNNFEFELLCSIFCKACGRAILKTELSNYISVNLPQGIRAHPSSMQSTFDCFFGVEELEYKCGKCKHNRSVAVQKFSRLPRVLIVHLKRYSFNKIWSLSKDEREVFISKYLKLSSHCTGATTPPLPLGESACVMDFQLLTLFQKTCSEINSSPTPSTASTSKCQDSLAVHTGSEKELEPQKSQGCFEGISRKQQQNDLGKNSKPNIVESESVYSGDGMHFDKEPLAASKTHQKNTFFSPIHRDGGKPTNIPGEGLADAYLQEVPENPKLKKCEKACIHGKLDFDSVSETTEDFCEGRKPRILQKFQKVAKQSQKCGKMRIHEQVPPQALPRSFPKPNAQGHTHNLGRPTKLNLQKANPNVPRSVDSSKNPGNKRVSNKKTESKATEPKRNVDEGDLHTYRLIGIISHIGDTPYSGHYISDAYDFKRQLWFTYNDLRVSNIQEAQLQDARLCTGYVFFYMHKDIFEEILAREENSQS